MKDFLKNLYKYLYNTEILPVPAMPVVAPKLPPVKSNSEKFMDICLEAYGTDPTPKDEVPDEVSCVFSITTLLKKLYPDFPILDYTPTMLRQLQSDKRFKATTEFKEGNIIISVTNTGNGRWQGHVGTCAKGGKILSNSSLTGEWSDKFDNLSWIQRYSRESQLATYLFELV